MYRDPNVKKPRLYLDTEAVWMWWEVIYKESLPRHFVTLSPLLGVSMRAGKDVN